MQGGQGPRSASEMQQHPTTESYSPESLYGTECGTGGAHGPLGPRAQKASPERATAQVLLGAYPRWILHESRELIGGRWSIRHIFRCWALLPAPHGEVCKHALTRRRLAQTPPVELDQPVRGIQEIWIHREGGRLAVGAVGSL